MLVSAQDRESHHQPRISRVLPPIGALGHLDLHGVHFLTLCSRPQGEPPPPRRVPADRWPRVLVAMWPETSVWLGVRLWVYRCCNQGRRSRLYVDVVSSGRGASTGRGSAVSVMWDARAGAQDDELAFSEFYVGCFSSVASITTVIMRSRATGLEIAQDAFVQLYVHWKRVRHYDAPEAWVRRVAIRLAVKEARRESRRRELSIAAWWPGQDVDCQPDVDVWQAVANLPEMHRAIVAMYYFGDLSVREIASALDKSESSVKVTLHRARRSLAASLGGGEVDPHG